MKFDILNRWSGEVQFTAEIDCTESALPSVKMGLAVKVAIKDGANLDGANLYGANLYGANLTRANLTRANLTRANLDGANLTRANLTRANLDGANLDGANLDGANLYGAKMWNASGNNKHIKSIQAGEYQVTYSADMMQIGCQLHSIAEWWSFDDRRIAEMDGKTALRFWATWKPLLQQIIAASPAVATGYVAPVAAAA